MAKDVSGVFNADGSLDEESVQLLGRALGRADEAPFSYLEFVKAVLALIERGRSAEDAVASVFITAEALGVGRAQLIDSAETYLRALDAEMGNFEAALEARLTSGLQADRQRLDKLDAQLARLVEQRAQLERKLAETERMRAEAERELESLRERVTERGATMKTTYETLRARIGEDLATMRAATA